MKTTAAFILAAANLVAGHGTFQSFVIGGKDQGHYFAIQKPSNGNNPIKDVTSPLMNCNGGAATSDQVSAAAGSSITFQWHHNDLNGQFPTGDADEPFAASHKGPIMVYAAPAASKGEGAVWTKIFEEGLTGGKWAVEKFISNKGAITIDLPNLAAGDYLIRPEILALHEANNQGGAQFYNGCGQLKITGSGSTKLPTSGTDMTKAYKATDPGVLVNIYNGISSYQIPGPKVWDGASSSGGSAAAPSTPTKTAAPAASAAPTKIAATPSAAAASPVVSQVAAAPSQAPSSGNALPKTFTIEQFITWLKATSGSSAARVRRHARSFQL